jgi:hypothetical protein
LRQGAFKKELLVFPIEEECFHHDLLRFPDRLPEVARFRRVGLCDRLIGMVKAGQEILLPAQESVIRWLTRLFKKTVLFEEEVVGLLAECEVFTEGCFEVLIHFG